jgi:hypothetical protein
MANATQSPGLPQDLSLQKPQNTTRRAQVWCSNHMLYNTQGTSVVQQPYAAQHAGHKCGAATICCTTRRAQVWCSNHMLYNTQGTSVVQQPYAVQLYLLLQRCPKSIVCGTCCGDTPAERDGNSQNSVCPHMALQFANVVHLLVAYPSMFECTSRNPSLSQPAISP